MTAAVAPSGPYMIKGSTLPDDVPGAIKDMQPYIDAGLAAPALEFLSPDQGTGARADHGGRRLRV